MKYPEDYINKVICGDCLEVMKDIPDKSVDLVLTSPPYNLGNFEKGSFYGGIERTLTYKTYSDNRDEDNYIKWQRDILTECRRLIKDTGVIFYNHKPRILNGEWNNRRNLIPFPIRQEIIWDRAGMTNFSGSFFANNTERLFIIAGNKWKVNRKYVGMGEVWRIIPEVNTEHPAPFPYELANKVISSSSKETDTILDPFLGSGTTAVAAKQLGRNFIGIEINPDYCKIAEDRLRQTELFTPKPKIDLIQSDIFNDNQKEATNARQ